MDQTRVPEPMFELQRQFHAVRKVLAANEGNKRHHLFFRNEGVRRIGFAEQQLSTGGDPKANQFGQLGCIQSYKFTIQMVVITGLRGGRKRQLGECVDLRSVQTIPAMPRHRVEQGDQKSARRQTLPFHRCTTDCCHKRPL